VYGAYPLLAVFPRDFREHRAVFVLRAGHDLPERAENANLARRNAGLLEAVEDFAECLAFEAK
jgi:hypothetical protein